MNKFQLTNWWDYTI